MVSLQLRAALVFALTAGCGAAGAQVLDHQKLLDGETFWDNRDWDWYKSNIPFFECPDRDIQTTYYYRWEVVTKHLTYGSPNSGYSFSEFIDRPFWSGAYGAISCPAGHQLYEARWLRDQRIARDYSRYWFSTPGAQPRRYSTWLADALWAVHLIQPKTAKGFVEYVSFPTQRLPALVQNYEAWEKDYFVPDVGLFWQTGHDDGMEININSRQTKDTVRGAPGYRPTLNSYMWADAMAISRIAKLKGDKPTAEKFRAKADALKANLQKKLWDPKREFFFHMYKQDEERDGFKIKALSLTHQTGKHAGSLRGREEIGYVPWQFNLPDAGYEAAWKFLMDKDYFFAEFGPTTVERNDPMFEISKRCCVWSGNSWPYATTQTLKGMANLLQNYQQNVVTKADYLKLLQVYARTHRKDGKPYLAEACHPDTGSWDGHDSYNHSEHYFHSGFNDLVITGLVGLKPRDDETVEVQPLAPESWDYFALDDINYHRLNLSIIWDKTGTRYGRGKGFQVLVDGKTLVSSQRLEKVTAKLPKARLTPGLYTVNYAVNNDGAYYPRIRASHVAPGTSVAKLIDGNYWYHRDPPNRWTCEGSPNATDWVEIDFGIARPIWKVSLYFLDDGKSILPPQSYKLEIWDGAVWKPFPEEDRKPSKPTGRCANAVYAKTTQPFAKQELVQKLRITFTHAADGKTGLTEIEACEWFWESHVERTDPAPAPKGNLALNTTGKGFPKATASYTSRFDKVEHANDGMVSFSGSPHNRWTNFESPNATDWLEIDFGQVNQVSRVELAIYDDGGGVQAPKEYAIQYWDGKAWRDATRQKRTPDKPIGGQFNEVSFEKVKTGKVRVVFTHDGKARSGVSEIVVWPE